MSNAAAARSMRVLAWLMPAVSAVLFAGLLILDGSGCRFIFDPAQPAPAFAYGLLLVPICALAFGLLGALVITLSPTVRFAWLMMLFGLALMLTLFLFSLGNCAVSSGASLSHGAELFWLSEIPGDLFAVFAFLLLFMLFPDGRFLTTRWRKLGLFLIGLLLIITLLRAFIPGTVYQTMGTAAIENPFGLDALGRLGLGGIVVPAHSLLFPIAILTGIVSLLVRWRRSAGETRQQTKWIAYFLATAGMFFIAVEVIGNTVYPAIFDGWFYLIVLAIFWLGLPLVFCLAVLRYRLYDIDIIIRRTLVYGVLTAVLIAIYFGVVLLAQSAIVALTGQESPIAIVISTLVIAALFNPLRRRLQDFIDRRFYRSKYDAVQTLETFAETARDEVDLEQLSSVLMRSVNETMQPETAVLWLKSANVVFPETDR